MFHFAHDFFFPRSFTVRNINWNRSRRVRASCRTRYLNLMTVYLSFLLLIFQQQLLKAVCVIDAEPRTDQDVVRRKNKLPDKVTTDYSVT